MKRASENEGEPKKTCAKGEEATKTKKIDEEAANCAEETGHSAEATEYGEEAKDPAQRSWIESEDEARAAEFPDDPA